VTTKTWGSVAAALAAGLAQTALAEARFDVDTAYGRLPKNVVPVDYSIAIVPNVAAKTFTGTETVSLKLREATGTVVFNTLNLTLKDLRLDGKPVKHVASALPVLAAASAGTCGRRLPCRQGRAQLSAARRIAPEVNNH
jgi:hypothetical protein